MAKAQAKVTTDHEEIRRWAEERGGKPACVRGTGGDGDIGMLRLDFPGYSGQDSLDHIGWDEWFQEFDERGLALLHQDETARGQKSNFNKIISRETAEARADGHGKFSRRHPERGSKTASSARRAATASRRTGTRTAAKTSRASTGGRTAKRGAAAKTGSKLKVQGRASNKSAAKATRGSTRADRTPSRRKAA